jgi:hypothetical protein
VPRRCFGKLWIPLNYTNGIFVINIKVVWDMAIAVDLDAKSSKKLRIL